MDEDPMLGAQGDEVSRVGSERACQAFEIIEVLRRTPRTRKEVVDRLTAAHPHRVHAVDGLCRGRFGTVGHVSEQRRKVIRVRNP